MQHFVEFPEPLILPQQCHLLPDKERHGQHTITASSQQLITELTRAQALVLAAETQHIRYNK